MKTLIIYLSATGNTERLAKAISNKSKDIDLVSISLKTKIPKSKFWVILKFGFLMTFSKVFRYSIPYIDVNQYDQIAIGTPVWMGRAAPPVIDVIKKLKVGQKVTGALVTCGGGEGNVFEDLCKRTSIVSIDHRLIVSEVDDYEDPLVHGRIEDFVSKLTQTKTSLIQTMNYE